MRSDDSSRLIDPEESVAIVCLLIAVAAFALLTVDEKPQPVAQPAAITTVCDFTIQQYAAGERWSPQQKAPECVTAARELPSHLLTMPVQEKQ